MTLLRQLRQRAQTLGHWPSARDLARSRHVPFETIRDRIYALQREGYVVHIGKGPNASYQWTQRAYQHLALKPPTLRPSLLSRRRRHIGSYVAQLHRRQRIQLAAHDHTLNAGTTNRYPAHTPQNATPPAELPVVE